MKTLILTEKPSVARDFSKAIQRSPKRGNGFIEDEKYIITWAVGHLVELFEPDDYDKRWKSWNFGTLPVIPEKFLYKPVERSIDQLNTIQNIISKNKIEKLIIATDAGREGEVIARTILISSNFLDESGSGRDNAERFWTSQALTPEVIREGLNELKPSKSYDRLWKAGQSRQIADWLVGMNGSRAATLKMNDLFSVGRVQTAVLSLIVKRCIERRSFKPEPYFLLYAFFKRGDEKYKGIWFKGKNNRFDKIDEAKGVAEKIAQKDALIKSVKRAMKKQPPPELFSLTDLQREANTKFGFTAKRTLDIAQNLYETRKCLSYPRTDSKVLGSKNVDMTRDLVNRFQNTYRKYFEGVNPDLISSKNKRVFNDAKLTDHHALIPLKPVPENCDGEEKKIYGLVLKRFAAVFHNPCEFEQTEIITECENETFRTKGKVILKPGWKAVYKDDAVVKKKKEEEEEENLPRVEKDDLYKVSDSEIKSKKTTPPALYTEAALLKDMTNPGKYVEGKELKKIYRGETGLGTQATRAQIIETLILRKYILREKKNIISTDKGELLIETLKKLKSASDLIAPSETAKWEMELEKIALGEAEDKPFIHRIKGFVEKIIEEFRSLPQIQGNVPDNKDSIAKCPSCGGGILGNKKAFGCSNWKAGCSFVIWRKTAGKEITEDIAKELIEYGRTEIYDDFVSKKGNRFRAKLSISEKDNWKVNLLFPEEKRTAIQDIKPKSYENLYGNCPSCGGVIIEGKKGFGCSNWPENSGSCKFVIWKEISGTLISEDNIKTLLNGDTTEEIIFNPGDKTEFKARLKLKKLPGNIKSENIKNHWETEFVY